MIDVNGDGVISLKELKNLVEKCGKEVSDEEVLDMVCIILFFYKSHFQESNLSIATNFKLKASDLNMDGNLTFEEFVALWTQMS